MRKLLLSHLFIIGAVLSLYAQNDPIKWGKIDDEALSMRVYAEDSSAGAVVLADYGQAFFTYSDDKGFQLNLDRITRIKILNKTGLKHGDQQIVLYHKGLNKQEVLNIKGVTYNLEGKKVVKSKLHRNDVFKEEHSENFNLLKFTMPNVREGSVIEFRYTLRTDFIYNFFTWKFQREIPVMLSEFRAKVPEYFHYQNFLSGYLPVTVSETNNYKDSFRWSRMKSPSGNSNSGWVNAGSSMQRGTLEPEGTQYRWAMEKVPAIKEEAYVTTMQDYIAKMDFELSYTKFPGAAIQQYSNSWEKLNGEFLKENRFGKQLGRARYLQEVVSGLLQGVEEEEEKILRITHYVKQHFHYNGKERVYTENNLRKVFQEKEGNAAEINLLLVLMLREAGLQADPVILSTRSHGRINPIIPMEKDFNFVVASVVFKDQRMLLDGTDADLPVSMLPYECLNQQGRLISEEHPGWVPLRNGELMKAASQGDVAILEGGLMEGELTLKHSGYEASENRLKYLDKGEVKYLEEIYGEKGWGIQEFKMEDPEISSFELTESMHLNIAEAVTITGDHMYFHPLLLGMKKENPFKLDARNFPVDFGCPQETLGMMKIKLPEGYEVEELPEPIAVTLPDNAGIFRFSVNKMNNELMVINMLKINKTIFMPEEYLILKNFYDLVIAKHAEQVVLKKIN